MTIELQNTANGEDGHYWTSRRELEVFYTQFLGPLIAISGEPAKASFDFSTINRPTAGAREN